MSGNGLMVRLTVSTGKTLAALSPQFRSHRGFLTHSLV